MGYGRFALTNVVATTPQASVMIDRVEAYSPVVWLWKAVWEDVSQSFVAAGAVRVDLLESQDPPKEFAGEVPENLLEVIEMIEESSGLVASWMPFATVDVVQAKMNDQAIVLREITWRESRFSLIVSHDRFSEYEWDLVADLNSEEMVVRFVSEEAGLMIENKLSAGEEQADLSVRILYKENLLEAVALFGREGWLPFEASWQGIDWSVASSDFGKEGPYARYDFTLSGDWKEGVYRNHISGETIPIEEDVYGLPSVSFESSLSGNLERLDIETFRLSSPGLKAQAVEPVGIELANRQLTGEMKWDIDLDLTLLQIEALAGSLSGEAFLSADEAGASVGRFVLQGTDVSYEDLTAEVFAIEATLQWPKLRIETMDIVLDTGSKVLAKGAADLANRQMAPSSLQIVFSEEVLKRFMPEGVAAQEVKASVEVEGPWESLTHSGSAEVGLFETKSLKPLSVAVEWQGEGTSFERLQVEAGNGEAGLEALLKGSLLDERIEVGMETFELSNVQGILASLDSPVAMTFLLGDLIEGAVEGFSLSGEEAQVVLATEFAYPEKANFSIEIKGLNTEEWVDPWLKTPSPKAQLNEMKMLAHWDEGPIEAEAMLDGTVELNESELLFKGELSLLKKSIRLNAFAVSDLEGELMKMEGELPYQVDLSTTDFLVADKGGKLALSIETSDSPTIISLVDVVHPLGVESLNAQVNLEGTLENPQGDLVFSILTKKGEGEHGVPPTRVKAKAQIDGRTLRISEMVAEVLEDRFEASLEVVWPEEALKLAALEPVEVDWLSTEVAFVAPKTKLAPIAFFAPQVLAPSGEFEAELNGNLVKGFNGFVTLENLNTRPIFPFGSFRDIQTRLEFGQTIATLQAFKGNIGREPMTMQGQIDFRDIDDLVFAFTMKGENLPMVRKAGLLLRSDLDVVVSKELESEAKITGTIEMREGLFLIDTRVLTASGGGGQSAKSRPPYFSVEVEPFADWELDIAVKGERFMRLRTPAATGALSIDMNLKGTLEEPLAIGRVEFDEGNLMFPFASFNLTEGLVDIRIEDPYTPMISLLGEARRFRYDLGIEITGSAFDPSVRFTSSPPLSSEQILLMVMTGDVPDSNFTYSTTQRASKIGTYLSQGLLSSGSEGGLGSRFSIESGQNLSEQGKETLEVEFKLDERFQLLGEYDEYDEWNGGVRWRILRRQPKERAPSEEEESK